MTSSPPFSRNKQVHWCNQMQPLLLTRQNAQLLTTSERQYNFYLVPYHNVPFQYAKFHEGTFLHSCDLLLEKAWNKILRDLVVYTVHFYVTRMHSVGCIPSAAVAIWGGGSAYGGVCPWGGSAHGEVSAHGRGACLGGGLPRGRCLPRGVCLGGVCPGGVCLGGVCQIPPLFLWTEWQTSVKILPFHNYVVDSNKKASQ